MAIEKLGWHFLALVSIMTSSLFYTWVWYRPQDWKGLCKGMDPCQRMAMYAHFLKVLQFVSIAMCTNSETVLARVTNPWYLLPALAMIAFGQHLNMTVYKLLGIDGVYYGARFGKSIPWQHGWPYNYLRDPQYLGSSLSLGGVLLLGGAPELCLHWLGNYCYLVWLESKVPETSTVASLG